MPDVDSTQARVFVSYSRQDGATFAAELRNKLLKEDLSVWQDIVGLEGGRDWWSQIEETIRYKALQHFVLVVTPAALASSVVRREIRLARQEGKTVSPIKGPGLGELSKLPRWLGQVFDLDLSEHFTTLIRVLKDQSRQKRVPMMAPEPPPDFVPRPKEFNTLKAQLLDAKGDAVAAITAALRGAGGYGKTTLAKALAHDPDIPDAYFDGILWAVLGEKPDARQIVLDQIVVLTGERPDVATLDAAAGKLAEALGNRRILMIVDDAWLEQDLRPFLQGGPNCVRLVTTRIDSVLPEKIVRQPVDAMQAGEASELLSAGLPQEQVARERSDLMKLAARLGEWAQLLKMVNGFLRDKVVTGGQSVRDAIAGANKRLNAKGLTVFDAGSETDRAKAIARTIGVSLEVLSEIERGRFGELGVFPEDAEIPIGVAQRLWETTGGLADFETEDLLSRLYNLSLLLDRDLGQRFFRLHDTIRHFLRDQAGMQGLVAQHKQLVAALDDVPNAEVDARTRRYFYLYLPHHLAAAQEREKLDKLLLDPSWLKAKLLTTNSPQALVFDYEQYGIGAIQTFIGQTLRLTAGILARDERQLIPQLLGRIMGYKAVGAAEFLETARGQLSPPAIIAQRPTLTPPGVESACLRLEGGWGVQALCMLADGRLASGSQNSIVRLWDTAAGVETARLRLEGQSGKVTALCSLPDGRLASGSDDGIIRLWDAASGVETACLEGHSGVISALCMLPDGRLASASYDNIIRLWDTVSGTETACLEGHSGGGIQALCMLRDGRLASGARDGTIRMWDTASGAETVRLAGHLGTVMALCMLPDGRLASGSHDRTIRLWDTASGLETACLEGAHPNEGVVVALCMLPSGRLASAAAGKTIRLWDTAAGIETARLEGHSHSLATLCALPDGRLASGSFDDTIRLWDTAAGVETARPEGHSDMVAALCSLPDGRLASGSYDTTIRLWDTAGVETARLEGHSGTTALCALPDGRLASGSYDKSIRLWDTAAGVETARLEGHSGVISALCMLPDGRLVSGSHDKTIRLWDTAAGVEIARLEGDSGGVAALCALPDGRLASGSWDNTVRLWDTAAGVEIVQLVTDAPSHCLAWLPSGRVVAGDSIGRLHWLEVVD